MSKYRHAPEITDEVISEAFEGANFGRTDYREFLGYSVLEKACGWHCGHTITTIMIDLKLITPKHLNLTKLGRMFLSDSYDDPLRTKPVPTVLPPEMDVDAAVEKWPMLDDYEAGIATDVWNQCRTESRVRACKPVVPSGITQILKELRSYNPKADEYGGKHIIPGWADRIEKALGIQSGGEVSDE